MAGRGFLAVTGLGLALLVSAAASAQMPAALQPPPPFLGSDLLRLCKESDNSPGQNQCLRFMQGAVLMYELVLAEHAEKAWFCPPREAPPALLRKNFLEYAAEAPDELKQDAIKVLKASLVDGYPCQE